MFHDHFVLAGPISDPAGVRHARSLEEGMQRIENGKSLFHARSDASATMWKERALWNFAGLKPWEDEGAATWYKMFLHNPADALKCADDAGAYLLTDRSTLLRQTGLQTITETTVFFEPQKDNDVLMNSCYALHRKSMSPDQAHAVESFLEYVRSQRGQDIIGNFGRAQVDAPLFATLDERYSRKSLKGGCPRDGKWREILILDCPSLHHPHKIARRNSNESSPGLTSKL